MSGVRQMSIHPDVVAEPAVPCVGGPADGQMMRCPADRILIVINAVDGIRAVSLPPVVNAGGQDIDQIQLAKDLGGYAGHYVRIENRLAWTTDA